MGTRGLFAIRYEGQYYIKYNHSDSYPEGLGKNLVSAIPADKEEFEQWFESMKKRCTEMTSDDDESEFEKSSSLPENDHRMDLYVDSKAHFDLQASGHTSTVR